MMEELEPNDRQNEGVIKPDAMRRLPEFARQVGGYRRDDVDRYIALLMRRIAELEVELTNQRRSNDETDAVMSSMRGTWAPADEIIERTEAARVVLLAAVQAAHRYSIEQESQQFSESQPSHAVGVGSQPEPFFATAQQTLQPQQALDLAPESVSEPLPSTQDTAEIAPISEVLEPPPPPVADLDKPPSPDPHGHWADV